MVDEASSNVQWIEYKVEDLGKLKTEENNGGLYILSPGSTYHLRAVTVDKDPAEAKPRKDDYTIWIK